MDSVWEYKIKLGLLVASKRIEIANNQARSKRASSSD